MILGRLIKIFEWKRSLRYFYQTNFLLENELKVYQIDESLQTIKSAATTVELFDILAKNRQPKLNTQQVMEGLTTIFNLKKHENSTLSSSHVIKDPEFIKLCKDLKNASKSFEANEIVQTLKTITYIGVPTDSKLTYILLNMLRRKINDLSLMNIVFLNFLLTKFIKSPLVEAIQMSLPIIFQIQLDTQIDHENVNELIELLNFASKSNVSDKTLLSIITALTLHGENLKFSQAKNVLWSLSVLSTFRVSYEKLLQNCFNVINENYKEVTYIEMSGILSVLVKKVFYKYTQFYNEEYFNKCAVVASERKIDFDDGIFLLKRYNKISFVSILLLDYLSEKITENPDNIINARLSKFLTYITGLSIANYIPKQWCVIKEHILKNKIFLETKNELPWLKFNLELLSLDCLTENLLQRIFSEDFLENHLEREQNIIDYIQLLSLYQAVKILYPCYIGTLPNEKFIHKAIELSRYRSTFPFESALKYIFGDNCILTNVSTKYGHLLDHLIVFDSNGNPLSIENIDEAQIISLEKLKARNNQLVAVLNLPKSHYAFNFPRLKGIFDMKMKTLEKLEVHTVPINYQYWNKMPEKEKFQFLEREIKRKLQSI